MAHVVLEPNRPFSRRLKIEVASENVYGGSIGVYWPDATGRRSYFAENAFGSSNEIKRAVVEEIRAALLHRRSLFRCTWTYAQDIASKATYAILRTSGSKETDKWIKTFDGEIESRNEQLKSAEAEIVRLKREVRKYESISGVKSAGILKNGSEHDLYAYEIHDILVDVIADAVNRCQAESRREHVLRAIIEANPINGTSINFREKVKAILRDYKSMSQSTRSALEELGFVIYEDGKHYKLVFEEDDRYTFVLAKTGSDHRGGLNSASDISKRLF